MRDAAFSLSNPSVLEINAEEFSLLDESLKRTRLFYDAYDYSNPRSPNAGKVVPNYGLKLGVLGQSFDRSVGRVLVTLDEFYGFIMWDKNTHTYGYFYLRVNFNEYP